MLSDILYSGFKHQYGFKSVGKAKVTIYAKRIDYLATVEGILRDGTSVKFEDEKLSDEYRTKKLWRYLQGMAEKHFNDITDIIEISVVCLFDGWVKVRYVYEKGAKATNIKMKD